MDNQSTGAEDIVRIGIPLMDPAGHRWYSDKSISCGSSRFCPVLTQSDSNDVRCIGLQHNCSAIAVENELGALCESVQASDSYETEHPLD